MYIVFFIVLLHFCINVIIGKVFRRWWHLKYCEILFSHLIMHSSQHIRNIIYNKEKTL